jgi:hypothetical protein
METEPGGRAAVTLADRHVRLTRSATLQGNRAGCLGRWGWIETELAGGHRLRIVAWHPFLARTDANFIDKATR